MTLYVSNRDGNGKTDEKGHYKFPSVAFSGDVVMPGLAVTQTSPISMNVLIGTGDFRIDSGNDYAYTGWNTTSVLVPIATADAANPRIDTVVMYVDKSAPTSPTPPNNPNIAKALAVKGTPSATPTAPSSATIQAAVGASNPYIVLANVRVNTGTVSIINANITDLRVPARIANDMVMEDSIKNGAVTSSKIASNTITSTNIANNGIQTASLADLAVATSKLANGGVTTAKFRPSLIWSNFPTSARYNTTTVGTFLIPGCTMSYTAGPTNETLLLWTGYMANKSTSGNGEIFLYVNGSAYGTNGYIDSAVAWPRGEFLNLVNVNANQTVSLAVYAYNQSTTQLSITTDRANWNPTIRGFSVYRP